MVWRVVLGVYVVDLRVFSSVKSVGNNSRKQVMYFNMVFKNFKTVLKEVCSGRF